MMLDKLIASTFVIVKQCSGVTNFAWFSALLNVCTTHFAMLSYAVLFEIKPSEKESK